MVLISDLRSPPLVSSNLLPSHSSLRCFQLFPIIGLVSGVSPVPVPLTISDPEPLPTSLFLSVRSSIHQPTHHPSIHHVFISPLLTFHSSSETQGVWVRLTSDSVSWCSQRAILRRTLLPPSFTLTQDSKRSKATEEVSFCASACPYLLPSLVVRGPPRGRGLLSLRTANEAAAN